MKRIADLNEDEARQVEEALAGLKVRGKAKAPDSRYLALKMKKPSVRKTLGFDPLAGEELEQLKPFLKLSRERV